VLNTLNDVCADEVISRKHMPEERKAISFQFLAFYCFLDVNEVEVLYCKSALLITNCSGAPRSMFRTSSMLKI
jgi:hypothetical protein